MVTKETRELLRDEEGAVAVWMAAGMTALMGMAALAIDTGHVYSEQNRLQAAADAAALAASAVMATGGSAQDAEDAAIEYAEKNLPPETFGNVLSEADIQEGEWDSDARSFSPGGSSPNAVRVTMRRTEANGNAVNTFLAGLVGYREMDVVVQAMASAVPGQPGCVVALDSGNTADSLQFKSTGSLNLGDCVPAANSTHPTKAIELNSIGSLQAGSLYSVGGIDLPGYLESGLDEPAQENQAPTTDPYADLPDPAPGACEYPTHSAGSSISPGVYCGGLSGGGGSLTIQPGTYYIVDGDLDLSGIGSVSCNCTAPGSGVTFVITGTTPSQIGTFALKSMSSLSLRAPSDSSYDYPGILIYVDRRASSSDTSELDTIGGLTFNGALYAPSQKLKLKSIDYTTQTDCAWIVGHNVTLDTIGRFGEVDNCAAYGTKSLSAGPVGGPRLVM